MAKEGKYQGLAAAKKRVAVSVFLNLSLAVAKITVGVISASGALLADGVHSLTDFLAALALYAGLWIAGRRHPSFHYGLYKAETVATMITAVAIIAVAYEIGRRAFFGGGAIPDVTIALPVAGFTLFISLFFGLYQLRSGRKLASPALEADGRDYLADALSTSVVFFSLLGAACGLDLDRWGSGVVALFVFKNGGELMYNALRDLMDGAIDRDTEREIVAMVESHPRVTRVKRCLSRKAGGRFLVDLDLVMQTPSHRIADQVSDRLEEEIPAAFPRVAMARVRTHFGPAESLRRMTPVSGLYSPAASAPVNAPWFLLEESEAASGAVLSRQFLENPFLFTDVDRKVRLGAWIISHKPDVFVVPDEAEGAVCELLRQAGIEIEPPRN